MMTGPIELAERYHESLTDNAFFEFIGRTLRCPCRAATREALATRKRKRAIAKALMESVNLQ